VSGTSGQGWKAPQDAPLVPPGARPGGTDERQGQPRPLLDRARRDTESIDTASTSTAPVTM
jgi:hypothetical protein